MLTEGASDPLTAKTAINVIRYRPEHVVAVFDSARRGVTSQELLGVGGSLPVIGSLADAPGANTLLIGIAPPGVDPETGKPHHVRLYSVASPRNGERPGHNNLALTVKRVVVDRDGKPTRGVASSYLCDLQKGDKVTVTGPYGSTFLMPNHPGAKLLMICTGTGAAPMRAMTERRRRRMGLGEGGEIMLFFGARRPEELPYFGPLMKLPKELIRVELAFSRVPGKPKEYVQDRMRACADAVRAMLASDDTFVFVCGHKKMEEGVLAALGDICKDGGTSFADLKDRMRREGRLHIETY